MAMRAERLTSVSSSPSETRARHRRLRQAVMDLGCAIARGDVTPAPGELEALAAVCDTEHLGPEAARVRRWMEPA
jgi:hypothetical protein